MSTRRQVLGALGALGCGFWPLHAAAADRARVVVVGGGFAGMSCIRSLRRLLPGLDITLVEPRDTFLTGPLSNATLAGFVSPQRIRVSLSAATKRLKLRWLRASAQSFDPQLKQLWLQDGSKLRGDFFVIAPGVAMRYERIEGLQAANSHRVPHAWLLDAQFGELRRRLDAVPDGGTILIAAPAMPYRCPLAPYERAAVFAWYLQQRSRRCKIVIADAKDDFPQSAAFLASWDALYPGVIDWLPRSLGGSVLSVDTKAQTAQLENEERIKADLISLIPPQSAADFALQADLADASGWCPVTPDTFESTRHAGVYVLGDACIAAPMPKSASAAASQGRACALAIAAHIDGQDAEPGLLQNHCYSLLAPNYGLSVSGEYRALAGRFNQLSLQASPAQADRSQRANEARQALVWQAQLMTDSFGPTRGFMP